MRILHTSDWHLGISLHHRSMMEEQKAFIRQIVELIRKKKIDIVIVAGDVFDSRVATSDAIALYSQAAVEICGEQGADLVVIAGNHDGAARLASCGSLLEQSGLYVTGKLPRELGPYRKGNTEIFAIPYFHIDEVRGQFSQCEIRSYEDAMACICKEIRRRMTPGFHHIIVAHAYVTGAELSESDQGALLGGAQQIGCGVFEGFDYVALGHLHRPQMVGKNVCYSGSPMGYSFGEAQQVKSVCLYDTESGSMERIPLRPLRRLRVLRGTLQQVLETPLDSETNEDYLKIELTDQPAGIELLELLREKYPNLLCVAGKSILPEGETVTLTAEEIETMAPELILEKFCRETADFEPTKQQTEWFSQALAQAGDGGDLQ